MSSLRKGIEKEHGKIPEAIPVAWEKGMGCRVRCGPLHGFVGRVVSLGDYPKVLLEGSLQGMPACVTIHQDSLEQVNGMTLEAAEN